MILFCPVVNLCSEPTLQADPSVEVFIGERFKLACLAEPFHDDYLLLYVFYKNGEFLNFPSEKSSYTTKEATLDHSGTYQCEVKIRDNKLTKKSNIVPISIKPQAHSAEMAAHIVQLFLILSLLALLPIKLQNRKQDG
ncbi:Fc receptor-like A isoform X1 [Stegostoma tigrinum]|uniref:Fc receptor-like A isoform X1 n=1 Tax=Stegostoma tigrinum TaxID=3053191 RepID=UPI0028706BDC|nr:Fc receptor-like A isoform X1 [Stegostoma tigrinum]